LAVSRPRHEYPLARFYSHAVLGVMFRSHAQSLAPRISTQPLYPASTLPEAAALFLNFISSFPATRSSFKLLGLICVAPRPLPTLRHWRSQSVLVSCRSTAGTPPLRWLYIVHIQVLSYNTVYKKQRKYRSGICNWISNSE
jgi:hypothetical protein